MTKSSKNDKITLLRTWEIGVKGEFTVPLFFFLGNSFIEVIHFPDNSPGESVQWNFSILSVFSTVIELCINHHNQFRTFSSLKKKLCTH